MNLIRSVFTALILFFSVSSYSQPENILTSIFHPSGVVIFDDEIYFSQHASGDVRKYGINEESNVSTLVKSSVGVPFGLGTFGNLLFVAESADNAILRIDISGELPTIRLLNDQFIGPTDIEIDEDFFYITVSEEQKVVRVDRQSNKVEILLSNIGFPSGVCKVGDQLFVADVEFDIIFKVDLTDPAFGAEEIKVNGGPNHLFLEGDYLYFSLFSDGKIGRFDVTDSNPSIEIILDGLDSPTGIVIKDNILYFADYIDLHGKIAKYELPTTNLIDEFGRKSIIAYPNPAANNVMLLNLEKKSNVSVFNKDGQFMFKENVSPNISLDVSILASGHYYIRLESSQVIPFVKM